MSVLYHYKRMYNGDKATIRDYRQVQQGTD